MTSEVIFLNTHKASAINTIISSLLLLMVLTAWVITIAMVRFEGTLQDQLEQIINQWQLYQAGFIVALMIGPVFLYFVLSLCKLLHMSFGFKKTAGITLFVFYLICITLSYGSQITLVPFYLRHQLTGMAEIWFFYNTDSIAYFLNQTGYALWAMGALILFGGLIREKGLHRWIGILFLSAALLSLLAYFGLLVDEPTLKTLTLASGGLIFPIPVIALVMAVKALRITVATDHDEGEVVSEATEDHHGNEVTQEKSNP